MNDRAQLARACAFGLLVMYLSLQLVGYASPSDPPPSGSYGELQPPDMVCPPATVEREACLLEYLAARSYSEHTDPNRVALSSAFPMLTIVFFAYVALKMTRVR